MRRLITLVACFATLCAQDARSDDDASRIDRGRAVFAQICAPCHGRGPGTDGAPMLPGTAALAAKYQGSVPAALEDRRGLTAEVLRAFVRSGAGAMPMFRRTELSDADIAAIAAFLAETSAPEQP